MSDRGGCQRNWWRGDVTGVIRTSVLLTKLILDLEFVRVGWPTNDAVVSLVSWDMRTLEVNIRTDEVCMLETCQNTAILTWPVLQAEYWHLYNKNLLWAYFSTCVPAPNLFETCHRDVGMLGDPRSINEGNLEFRVQRFHQFLRMQTLK